MASEHATFGDEIGVVRWHVWEATYTPMAEPDGSMSGHPRVEVYEKVQPYSRRRHSRGVHRGVFGVMVTRGPEAEHSAQQHGGHRSR